MRFCFLPLIAILLPCNALAQGPSFDCRRAGTSTEIAICNSQHLSNLDRDIAALFADLNRVLNGAQRDFVINEQRRWLARRDACGSDRSCISDWSERRVRELEMRSRDVFR